MVKKLYSNKDCTIAINDETIIDLDKREAVAKQI